VFIDAHAHAAGPLCTAESIRETAVKFHLERICLCTGPKNNVQLGRPPSLPLPKNPNSNYLLNRMLRLAYRSFLKDKGDGNAFVLELTRAIPETVVPMYWVNPLDPIQLANLDRDLVAYQAKGIKLHQAWDAFSFEAAQFRRVAEVARSHSLPIFCHIYCKPQTRKLVRFLEANREVTFIVGHMAGLELFRECRPRLDRVFFDTSGSERIQVKHIQQAVDWFGCEHVLFGSDTPYASLEAGLEKVDQLKISDAMKERIYRKNAEDIYLCQHYQRG